MVRSWVEPIGGVAASQPNELASVPKDPARRSTAVYAGPLGCAVPSGVERAGALTVARARGVLFLLGSSNGTHVIGQMLGRLHLSSPGPRPFLSRHLLAPSHNQHEVQVLYDTGSLEVGER